ncbi:cytochrome P450, partial [Vararia minispora EC-137]
HAILRYTRSPWRSLPPGPMGLPVIGSALKMSDKQWLLDDCSLPGDVVYLNVAGQPTVVLNTQRAAADLLDRRAATCSSRPRFIVINELLSGGLFFAFSPHNDLWRRMRRGAHEAFKISAAARYHDMQAEEAARLALSIVSAGKEDVVQELSALKSHFHRFASSLVLAITYDRPIRGEDPGSDQQILKGVEAYDAKAERAITPGAYLVEMLPWMLHIPSWLAKWKREALDNHEWATGFFKGVLDNVQARMQAHNARDCLVTTLMENRDKLGLSEKEIVWTAGIMYAVGSSTTAEMLDWWTLAMIAYPWTQQRAQAELDAVIGHGRAPRVEDRLQLPYLDALVRETLRWRTTLPVGLPHMNEADEWYNGMFIPKGTTLIPNVYPCNLDPKVYGPDARAFNPARHLDEIGQLKPAPADTKEEGHVAFGFGRRICVGRHVAADSLFAAIATLLWAFKIEKVGDVDAEGFSTTGFTLHPNPFKCKFRPRFPEVEVVL